MGDDLELELRVVPRVAHRAKAPTISMFTPVLDEIDAYVGVDLRQERGGLLLGSHDSGAWSVDVRAQLPALSADGRRDSLTFTHAAWKELDEEREKRFPQLRVVGWYHSHPDFGVFLSGHDRFIHEHFFSSPFHLAYVIDPVRRDCGLFGWLDGRIEPVTWNVVDSSSDAITDRGPPHDEGDGTGV